MTHRKPMADITELASTLAEGQRLMALDLGSKTIGIALSDLGRTIANPYETLRRGKFKADARTLQTIIGENDVGGLVIGLPLNMDGSEGPRCQSVRQFAASLAEVAGLALPVAFWDERLSTAAVERLLIAEADMSRRRRAQVVDKMAAAYILQGALDALGQQVQEQ